MATQDSLFLNQSKSQHCLLDEGIVVYEYTVGIL